jgi:hypothetical protein
MFSLCHSGGGICRCCAQEQRGMGREWGVAGLPARVSSPALGCIFERWPGIPGDWHRTCRSTLAYEFAVDSAESGRGSDQRPPLAPAFDGPPAVHRWRLPDPFHRHWRGGCSTGDGIALRAAIGLLLARQSGSRASQMDGGRWAGNRRRHSCLRGDLSRPFEEFPNR